MNPKDHAEDTLLLAEVAATTERTASWDTNGKGSYATVRVLFSPGLTTDAVAPTISLLSSDDTEVTNHATIVATTSISIGAAAGTTRAMQIYKVDLRGEKRYLRLVVTPGTVATDDAVAISAVGTIHHLGQGPSSTSGMVYVPNTSTVGQVTVV